MKFKKKYKINMDFLYKHADFLDFFDKKKIYQFLGMTIKVNEEERLRVIFKNLLDKAVLNPDHDMEVDCTYCRRIGFIFIIKKGKNKTMLVLSNENKDYFISIDNVMCYYKKKDLLESLTALDKQFGDYTSLVNNVNKFL